jgi:acyl-coenzyme A synthetase/AMP-(fatty) acid ligase
LRPAPPGRTGPEFARTATNVTIARIYEQARQNPGKTAVVHNGVEYGYADFARRIEVARRFLAQRELPVGSVAVVCLESLHDEWVIGFALRSLGLNTISARDAREARQFALRNIGCVVTGVAKRGAEMSALASALRWRHVRIPADLDRRAGGFDLSAIPELPSGAGGHILRTSGTTGAYKMVLRDAATEAMALPLHAEINGITHRAVVYVANFGLWTAGGYRWPLITWSTGGTVVIHQAPDVHQPLSRHDMTHIFTTPDMLASLLGAADGAPRRNDATRLLVTGGAMTKALLVEAKRHLTRQVFSVLASTEALTLAITPVDGPDDLLWHRIHPSREVQVVDETGAMLEPGHEGMIRVRIIDGLAGYLDDEEATRAYFRDGYFYPGDLGVLGTDGRMSMRGRASDVVNVLGNKVATAPIERALEDRLGVEGVCIVSIPGDEPDDEIHVVIEAKRRPTLAELDAAGRIELGLIARVPVKVDFIDELPRNDMGKVQRLVLKQRLIQSREAGHGVAPQAR